MKSKFEFDKKIDEMLIDKLKIYLDNELDEDFTALQGLLLLDFIKEEMGHEFYNQGIKEGIKFMTEKIDDMYELEIHKR